MVEVVKVCRVNVVRGGYLGEVLVFKASWT